MPGSAPSNSTGTGQGSQDFAPAVQVEQQQIVTFVEEGGVPEQEMPIPPPGRGFLAPAKDSLGNSVVGFLERPLEFANFNWNSTAMRGGKLAEINFPHDWLASTMIREKLAGFRYLRCNFHVKVQVNAQQMNAGRLLMIWQPFWHQLNFTPASALTIPGITGYPLRVDLDLSEATAFDIEVPYVNNCSHYDLINGMGTGGTVQIYCYSSLTGLSEVDATIWIWASNIDVQLPTGLPLSVPALASGPVQAMLHPLDNVPRFEEGDPSGSGSDGFRGVTPEPSQARVNAEKKSGFISRILDIGGRMAMAASAIPKIGPFALAGGAIARGLGKLASIFGWSKPMVDAVPTQVRSMFLRTMANYNGPFDGKQMAFDVENQTDIPTFLYGCDEDEMSLQYILRRPVFLDAFTMDGSDPAGHLIWSWPVGPDACRKVTNTLVTHPTLEATGVQFQNTYLSYLASIFTFWRGSIEYSFKIVKTPFHSGRVRVLYVPGADSTTDFTTVDQSKCYSKVYDFREGISFDFLVPYNWLTPWKELDRSYIGSASHPPLKGIPTGMIYVTVVNSLRNPSTTANHVEFLVETRAGEDFQFAVPGRTTNTWVLYDNNDTVTELSSEALPRGQVQSSFYSNPTGVDVGVNALGIGEVVTSFRQLLKRYAPLPPEAVSPLVGNILLPSFFMSDLGASSPASAGERLVKFDDLFRWAAPLYRLMSGEMRVSVVHKSTREPQRTTLIPGSWMATSFNMDLTGTRPKEVGWSIVEQCGPPEPVMELEVPFYQNFPAVLTGLGAPKQIVSDAVLAPTDRYNFTPSNTGTGLQHIPVTEDWSEGDVYRSMGERFSFGMMLGPPPTIRFDPLA